MAKVAAPYSSYQKVCNLMLRFTDEQASKFMADAGWRRYPSAYRYGEIFDVIDVPMPGGRLFSSTADIKDHVSTVIRVAELLHQIPYALIDAEYWDGLLDIATMLNQDLGDDGEE